MVAYAAVGIRGTCANLVARVLGRRIIAPAPTDDVVVESLQHAVVVARFLAVVVVWGIERLLAGKECMAQAIGNRAGRDLARLVYHAIARRGIGIPRTVRKGAVASQGRAPECISGVERAGVCTIVAMSESGGQARVNGPLQNCIGK